MKKSILYLVLLTLGSVSTAFAQLEGKRFISGSAGLGFNNRNPVNNRSEHGYSYNFNIGLGKFKTATKTGEWTILSSLGGGKNYLDIPTQSIIRKGIGSFAIGGGYTWNYYKHFSDKFGVFGGPGLTLRYAYSKITDSSGENIYEQKSNEVAVSFQLAAGAYYALNERWWLIGSLAFSNPATVSYVFGKAESLTSDAESKNSGFHYKFSPSLNFPSVGLGLRYFFKD
jgi:hypothetical protein